MDASVPLKQILPFVSKKGLIVLFITHTHGDHTAYMDEYVDAFPNLVVMMITSLTWLPACVQGTNFLWMHLYP